MVVYLLSNQHLKDSKNVYLQIIDLIDQRQLAIVDVLTKTFEEAQGDARSAFIRDLQKPVKVLIRKRHFELSPLAMLIGELVEMPVSCDFV